MWAALARNRRETCEANALALSVKGIADDIENLTGAGDGAAGIAAAVRGIAKDVDALKRIVPTTQGGACSNSLADAGDNINTDADNADTTNPMETKPIDTMPPGTEIAPKHFDEKVAEELALHRDAGIADVVVVMGMPPVDDESRVAHFELIGGGKAHRSSSDVIIEEVAE